MKFHEISVDKQKDITEYFEQVIFLKILCHIFENEMSVVPLKLACNFSKYQIEQFATFFW